MRWIPSPDIVQKSVVTTIVVSADERIVAKIMEQTKALPAPHEAGEERPKNSPATMKIGRARMRVGIRRMAKEREKKIQKRSKG